MVGAGCRLLMVSFSGLLVLVQFLVFDFVFLVYGDILLSTIC